MHTHVHAHDAALKNSFQRDVYSNVITKRRKVSLTKGILAGIRTRYFFNETQIRALR